MGRLFGTDGIRGVAGKDLTASLAMTIGHAVAAVLSDGKKKRPTILVGSDTRISSTMLGAALSAGICAAGADVVNLGVVPTPAVAYLVREMHTDAGVMISASHNSFEYNGIKVFNADGYKLPDELEEAVETLVLNAEEHPMPGAVDGAIGMIRDGSDALEKYKAHLLSSTSERFDGLHVAIDCACGSASYTAAEIFSKLGADVHMLSDKPDGCNVNLACGSTHMEALTAYVLEHHMDAGLAFDGDADRFLCVDAEGHLVDGDQVMAICSLDMKHHGMLKHNTAVGTVMTNFGFTRFCDKNGIQFIATKVGDRFVLEEMLVGDYAIGGEQSGHIIFRNYATTGDGQLTAIQLLSIMVREKKSLAELASVMTRSPQKLINLTVTPEAKLRFYTDGAVQVALEDAKNALGNAGRIVVRPSGTEPLLRVMAEGDDPALIEEVADRVAKVISKSLC